MLFGIQKKIYRTLTIFIIFSFACFNTFAAETTNPKKAFKVAIYSMQAIRAELSKRDEVKKIDDKVRKEMGPKYEELLKKQDEIQKRQEAFLAQQSVLSAGEKTKKQGEIETEIMKLNQSKQDFNNEINKRVADENKPIFIKINKIVHQIFTTENADVAINIDDQPFFAAKSSVDITNKIITTYSSTFKDTSNAKK